MRIALVAPALVVVVTACTSGHPPPYERLSARAAAYVVPGSEGWGAGELCPGDVDCSGPITLDAVARYDWFRIGDLGDLGDVHPWPPDVEIVREVLDGANDVWAGVEPSADYVAVFVAFDQRNRLAGVGHAAAEYFTVPMAELAAAANAASGRAFVEPLMSR